MTESVTSRFKLLSFKSKESSSLHSSWCVLSLALHRCLDWTTGLLLDENLAVSIGLDSFSSTVLLGNLEIQGIIPYGWRNLVSIDSLVTEILELHSPRDYCADDHAL